MGATDSAIRAAKRARQAVERATEDPAEAIEDHARTGRALAAPDSLDDLGRAVLHAWITRHAVAPQMEAAIQSYTYAIQEAETAGRELPEGHPYTDQRAIYQYSARVMGSQVGRAYVRELTSQLSHAVTPQLLIVQLQRMISDDDAPHMARLGAIRETWRLLREGAELGILEQSRPKIRVIDAGDVQRLTDAELEELEREAYG